ncbi:MAG: hypothetical protein JSV70_04650 [bacterium]|nr:MAG: hypothetical protein JSV70_04650 [bacterium]
MSGSWSRVALLSLLVAIFLSGCGGSDGSDGSRDLFLFMTTDSWTENPTSRDHYYLEGFVSTGLAPGTCPVWDADETRLLTGITVTWENTTTAQSGLAGQNLQYGCVFLMGCGCWHVWEADVPLSMGVNSITILAVDSDGHEDIMNFAVERQ